MTNEEGSYPNLLLATKRRRRRTALVEVCKIHAWVWL